MKQKDKVDYSLFDKVNEATEKRRNTVTISNLSPLIYNKEKRDQLFRNGVVLVTGVVMVIGAINLGNHLVKTFYNPEKVLERELQIHSDTYTVDGKHVDPTDPHDCAIGGPEEGTISERFVRYATENNISYPEFVEKVQKYGTSIIDLNDIYINPDGSYEVRLQPDSYEASNSNGFSK